MDKEPREANNVSMANRSQIEALGSDRSVWRRLVEAFKYHGEDRDGCVWEQRWYVHQSSFRTLEEDFQPIVVLLWEYFCPMSTLASLTYSFLRPASLTFQGVCLTLLAAWTLQFLLDQLRSHWIRRQFAEFATLNKCSPAKKLTKPFFGSLRHKLKLLLRPGGDLLDNVFAEKFRKYGSTHALHDRSGLPKVIHTSDPANLNFILKGKVNDWAPSKARARTMYPLAQDGLLNSQGEAWHHNRQLIVRHINNKRSRDVRHLEPDIQLLFDAIGFEDSDGWTREFDLLDLFHRLSLDMSTTYLLGTSANSQLNGMRDTKRKAVMEEFDLVPAKRNHQLTYGEAYETVRNYFSWRSKLGSKYWMADGLEYRRACDTLNDFADELIKRAISHRSEFSKDDQECGGDRYGLIDNLVKDIGDSVQIRNLVMDLFIAGQNMTGTLSAWVFAQLEAHPDIFNKVRNEVLLKFGTEDEPLAPLNWDNLQSCTNMQNVIHETLRMYPLLANIGRNARCDTYLPRGGGEDGQQKIAVPKGAAVTCNVYLMHRQEDVWGNDAWEFNPDRWEGRKKTKSYAPFGAGPRICVGQQLTMTEISFLMARMMQHFSEMKSPEGQDNLTKGYRVVVAPKNGVKVRLRRATPLARSPILGAFSV